MEKIMEIHPRADTSRGRPSRRSGWWRGCAVLVAVVGVSVGGCDDIAKVTRFTPIEDPEQLFMGVTINHRAINLSVAPPHDTFQLEVTPRDGLGQRLNGLPAPTFRSTDTTRVWVTPEGLIQARGAAAGVGVIAEILTEDNIRHADTAFVNVTSNPNPPALTTFSITPATPEERVWNIIPTSGAGVFGGALFLVAGVNLLQPSLPRVMLDANGDAISGLQIEYRSLDPYVGTVNRQTGSVSGGSALGTARFVATTMAYGVAMSDTATITLDLPVVHGPFIRRGSDGTPVLFPSEVTIQENGYAFWRNELPEEVEVRFANPTNVEEITELCAAFGGGLCGSRNIPGFDGSTGSIFEVVRGRRFPVPGIYEYEIPQTGHTGRVVVVAKEATP